jgi:hypothetical protein
MRPVAHCEVTAFFVYANEPAACANIFAIIKPSMFMPVVYRFYIFQIASKP